MRALGVVAVDESALADVSLKVKGWVGSLQANAVGARVERGDVLFTLYSPELYSAQEEYLQALRSQAERAGDGRARSRGLARARGRAQARALGRLGRATSPPSRGAASPSRSCRSARR